MSNDKNRIALLEKLKIDKAKIVQELRKAIIGQDKVIEEVLIALFAKGHCLVEGVPGLAKTMLISSLAKSLNLKFSRIQFTPDLMPSDITGTDILAESKADGKRYFEYIKGPIFANIILADEINRTPPKTQSALLQAMQEYQVTAGNSTYNLDQPFLVLATQNPIEQEGTYPLPEAQVDRFMLKLNVTYPSPEEELEIMNRMSSGPEPGVKPVVTPKAIISARGVVEEIYVSDAIKLYIRDIVYATRTPEAYDLKDLKPLISFGASPRASINLLRAARAHAFLRHRGYVTPDDVKAVGMDILRHRVLVTYEAEAEEKTPEMVVQEIINHIEVP